MRMSLLALLFVSVVVFLWGADRQSKRNTEWQSNDQSAYMNYAKQLAQSDFRYVGDRNRMPLYPGIMALFYKDEMSDEEFFVIGKRIGIAIGIIVLIVTFFVFKRGTRTMDAITAVLVAMFTVFAFKSPYFMADVLFYGIGLLLFVLLLSIIEQPRVLTACFAGLISGIGHLTKASILPAIVLCLICLLICAVVELRRYCYKSDVGTNQSLSTRGVLIAPIYCAGILAMIFVLVIYPYIRTSKERFGYYFYNVNTTFYVWYDSWREVELGTNAHGDRVGWPVMPEEDIPSFRKYLQHHTFVDVVRRFTRGFGVISWRAIRSYGYAEFLVLYLIALTALIIQNGGPVSFFTPFWRNNPSLVVFVAAYFIGYLALYAWYTPIASGNRFVLAMFLPLMFLILRGLSFAQSHNMTIRIHGTILRASAISPTIFLFLILYLVFMFPHRISTMYGGD